MIASLNFGHKLGTFTLGFVVVLVAVALLLVVVATVLHRTRTKSDFARPGLWAVTGPFGAGKTYLLTHVAMRSLKAGRPVFSNYGVVGAQRVATWDDVLAVPDGSVVLLAELQLWWPSDVRAGPPGIGQWVSQLRHHGITCLWDSQHWLFVSTRFRKLTFGVWQGRGQLGGHEYTLYTAFGYRHDFIRGTQRERKARIAVMRVRRDPEVMAAYDTLEDVFDITPSWVPQAQRRNAQVVLHVPGRPGGGGGANGRHRAVARDVPAPPDGYVLT